MTILGIDPGTTRIGYAVVAQASSQKTIHTASPINALAYGLLQIGKHLDRTTCGKHNYSYLKIARSFEKLIVGWKPNIIALEKIFFAKNSKTAMAVAEVRGIIKMVSQKHNIEIMEFSPNEVKSGVTGYGLAQKSQVYKMIKMLLHIKKNIKIDDVSDALAVALMPLLSKKIEEN